SDRPEDHRGAHGSIERDVRRGRRDGSLTERPEEPGATLARRRADRRLERRTERCDRECPSDTDDNPDGAPEDALDERLPCHLADNEPLRPAERLQRAELAD